MHLINLMLQDCYSRQISILRNGLYHFFTQKTDLKCYLFRVQYIEVHRVTYCLRPGVIIIPVYRFVMSMRADPGYFAPCSYSIIQGL